MNDPTLELVLEFGATPNVIVPLVVWVDPAGSGATRVIHEGSVPTLQVAPPLAVTPTLKVCPADGAPLTLKEVCDKVIDGVCPAPACVTAKVLPAIVNVPVSELELGLDATAY